MHDSLDETAAYGTHAEGQGFGGCPRGLCSVSTILPALTSPLHRPVNVPELAGSARLLRWEQDGNTRAVHERSRPVPADPARSRMTRANDSAEQANCTVVLADAGLQNQRLRPTLTAQVNIASIVAGPVTPRKR